MSDGLIVNISSGKAFWSTYCHSTFNWDKAGVACYCTDDFAFTHLLIDLHDDSYI